MGGIMAPLKAPLQSLADFLKSKKFHYALTEDGEAVVAVVVGDLWRWTIRCTVDQEATILTLVSYLPANIPEAQRGACARLIARLNYGKRLGAFHLDQKDGEVTYCISNILDSEPVPEEVLDRMLWTSYSMVNEHTSEVLRLVATEAKPRRGKSQKVLNPPPDSPVDRN